MLGLSTMLVVGAVVARSHSLNMEQLLKRHFKEDEENFKELKDSDAKVFELLAIHGEHMSHIRKDLSEVSESVKDFKKSFVRIEPMVASWEQKGITNRTLRGWGEELKWWAGFFAALGIVTGGLVWFVRVIIKNI